MEKNYRIHTNIINDTVLNVNMQQDYDFLEVLTMKLRQKDSYKLHSSNYGVIIGRVLANDAFGIPNAKVSIFIERDANDPTYMQSVYPFTEVIDSDKYGRRYNLLPDHSDDDCYRIVGTFPNKRLVLDDSVTLEIYDKYYKFSTVTNKAGDYMLFGVPSGSQQIHVDIDLSDIGILSQMPTDFEHKGYNMSMFDSPRQFKESTNLDGLAQIYSQNKSVFVYPFWGDENLGNGIAAITRCDVQMQYKFEPTCVFMGAIFSDNEGNAIGHKCAPSEDNGMNFQLVTGEGTIEMIRKTTDGLVEEFSIQGNQLIDGDGVWCYQIPMNLDFIATDEYGNIIPTDNPNKGIPTRAQVRFRFSKNETGDEGHSRHTAKYLVPMNPTLIDNQPRTAEDGAYIEKMYNFGSNTPDDCFRDLYWNNVYSVKNYIPKIQMAHRAYAPNYTGLKGSNLATDQNPVPFNKLRIDIPVMYAIVCIIFLIVRAIVQVINNIINVFNFVLNIINRIRDICIPLVDFCPFGWLPSLCCIGCISLGGGLSPDNTAYYPSCDRRGMDAADCPDGMENCKKSANSSELLDLVQQRLAEDYKIVKLDFYQDWVNGSLYMPLWYWRKRKKSSFLFGLIPISAKNEYCSCNKIYSRLKSYITCSIKYTNKELGVSDGSLPEGEDNWHRSKKRSSRIFIPYGLIKDVTNKDGLKAYYYSAIQPTSDAGIRDMKDRASGFTAFRLFATDIILLGNLNENNLYGIPQLFKALPATTANIPPIATVRDSTDADEGKETENTLADSGDTGPSVTTGMDWIDGEGTPAYSDGLFMLLSCTYAHTKAKSCINVERLSELGMNLDMTYDVLYPTSNSLSTGKFEHDGFITKYELDDTDNRAMFATMNHLGFVPQTYQSTKKNFNETQVLDDHTNYYIPKFKFLYPTDLDGRMLPLIDRYRNGFQQVLTDDRDGAYINFRLGDVQPRTIKGGQFYDGNAMPLYNNSFYFYFGIKRGNTAIDKFNKMFVGQCFKNSKSPFTLDIDTRPASYCPNNYQGDLGKSLIKVSSDDIQIPYTYRLYDNNGTEVAKSLDEGLETTTFEIDKIKNGEYTLKIVDVNGRSVTEKINLEISKISMEYETRGLGTKYYEADESQGIAQTTMFEICQHDYQGKVTFKKLFLDGYEFEIGTNTHVLERTSGHITVQVYAKTISDNYNIFNTAETAATSSDTGFYVADMVFSAITSEDISACTCSGNGESVIEPDFFTEYTLADKMSQDEEDRTIFVFGFNIYKPGTYLATITQHQEGNYCPLSGTSANTSSLGINIPNGKSFYAFLNKMPVKFMIDKEGWYFYPPSNQQDKLENWLKIHKQDSYKFPSYQQRDIWGDFIMLTDELENSLNKNNVIKYQFSSIFNLSKAAYVTNSGNKFQYTAEGGVQPLLYRSLAPDYAEIDKITTKFLYSDNNYVTVEPTYPNIVGNNYLDGEASSGPRVNGFYTNARNRERLGNYFMVATNNGRYINTYTGDCSEYSIQIPTDAPVNITDEWKMLGETNSLNTIPEIVVSGSSEAVSCQSNIKPHFKGMFVDRRFDYDLAVLGPITSSMIPSEMNFGSDAVKNQSTCIRMLGTIYNGIEMAYDDEYNIISAHYESGWTSAMTSSSTESDDEDAIIITWEEEITPLPSGDVVSSDTTLEYTYYYDSGNTNDVGIIHNSGGTYWKDYGDGINAMLKASGFSDIYYNKELTNQPILKTYYSAILRNNDIRQLFWSNENSDTLKRVASWSGNTWEDSGLTLYLFDHFSDTDLYNGEFGTSSSYPTKRFIDIGKIEPAKNLKFSLSSCGYDLGLDLNDETQLFNSVINEGANLEIQFNFGCLTPSPKGEEEDYGHVFYSRNISGETDVDVTGEVELRCKSINIGMNYNSTDYGDLKAYSRPLKILTLDDVIGLKMDIVSNSTEQIKDKWLNLSRTLGRVSGNNELRIREKNGWVDIPREDWSIKHTHIENGHYYNEEFPYSVRNDDNYYIYYSENRLEYDENDMYNCRVGCTGYDAWLMPHNQGYAVFQLDSNGYNPLDSIEFFTVCAMRDLVPTIDEHLTKKIMLFDFSDFYDIRGIKINYSYKLTNERKTIEFAIKISNNSDNKAINNKDIENIEVTFRTHNINPSYAHEWSRFFLKLGEDYNYEKYNEPSDNGTIIKSLHTIECVQVEGATLYIREMCIYVTLKNGLIYKILFDLGSLY